MGLIKKKKDKEDDTQSIDSQSPDKENKLKKMFKKKNRDSDMSSTPSLSPDNMDEKEKKKHWYSMGKKKTGGGPSTENLGTSGDVIEETEAPIPEDPPPKSSSREKFADDGPRSRSGSSRSQRRRPSKPREPATEEPKEDFSTALMRKSSEEVQTRTRPRDVRNRSNDSIESPQQRTMARDRSASSVRSRKSSRDASRENMRRKEDPPPPVPTGIVYKSMNRSGEVSPSIPARELPKNLIQDREVDGSDPTLVRRDRKASGRSTRRRPSQKSEPEVKSEDVPPVPQSIPKTEPSIKRNRSQHSEDEFIADADATNNLNAITSKTKTNLQRDKKWPKEAQELFDYFSSDFPYIFEEDFSPVVLALSIMLEKGPIKDLQNLSHLILKAEKAFEVLVSDRYDQFQKSLETYTSLIENVSISMESSKRAYARGMEIKETLVERNEDLLTLHNKSLHLRDTLGQVDIIRKIQIQIESVESLNEKRKFLTMARTLKKALHNCQNFDLQKVYQMDNLRKDIVRKMNITIEKAIHELQDIIFLKHPKCASRSLQFEDAFASKDQNRKEKIIDDMNPLLLKTIKDNNYNPKLIEDYDNYENVDVMEYLHLLVLSVVELERSNELIESITRSIQAQMDEIMEMAKSLILKEFSNYKILPMQPDTLTIDELAIKVLDSYLQFLFSKIVGIMHFIYITEEVLRKFTKVRIFDDSWAIFRKELLAFMENYLLGNTIANLDSLKNEKARTLMFKLKHVNFSPSSTLFKPPSNALLSFDPYSVKVDSNSSNLANSNIFNMLSIFPNTVSFLDVAMRLTPLKDSDLIMFLDDCFQQYYFPQVQSQINDILDNIVADTDAFHLENNQDSILRITKRTSRLIKSLATLMSLLPFHNNEYSLILFNLIKKVYDRCKTFLNGILN
eukprot:NODE_227_length_12294_cov_1.542681.p1 type:complete len:905 gc:universal NODE_227_length_12294_cov_1.542681:10497-7783(-)